MTGGGGRFRFFRQDRGGDFGLRSVPEILRRKLQIVKVEGGGYDLCCLEKFAKEETVGC